MDTAMFRKLTKISILCLILCGCSADQLTPSSRYIRPFTYEASFDSNNQVIAISITNSTAQAICFSALDLPNPNGTWSGPMGLYQVRAGNQLLTHAMKTVDRVQV
jgi:hypothetical protein